MDAMIKQLYADARAFMKTKPDDRNRWVYYGNFKRKLEPFCLSNDEYQAITDKMLAILNL